MGDYSPHKPPFGVRSCKVVIVHPGLMFVSDDTLDKCHGENYWVVRLGNLSCLSPFVVCSTIFDGHPNLTSVGVSPNGTPSIDGSKAIDKVPKAAEVS